MRLAFFFVAALLYVGSTIWLQHKVSTLNAATIETTLTALAKERKNLDDEKKIQETLKLRLENEQRSAFYQALLGTAGASVGIIAGLFGMWMAVAQYIGAKERERLDRASKDLESLWEGLATAGSGHTQAASIAALQHFLLPDKAEYHDRVAAALALVARMDDRPAIVDSTLRPILEKAMRAIPASMRSVSWQGTSIEGLDLSGLDLGAFDFRDSKLIEAKCDGCNFAGARFDASTLVRSSFERAILDGASLEYADLADANLSCASLARANLGHVRIKNLNLTDAILADAHLTLLDTDFRLTRGWRSAKFSDGVRERLLAKYGPPVVGPRVLMLVPEFPPIVEGGLWTAVYHLLRRLRAAGADVSVAVPLSPGQVSFDEFANEIPVIALGENRGDAAKAGFTTYSTGENADGKGQRGYSPYAAPTMEMVRRFAEVAPESIAELGQRFDVVHAHDWLMFPAARAIAGRLRCPWVAHFHSTETDRRGGDPHPAIAGVEQEACRTADAIVVPSRFTQARLGEVYGVPADRIAVVPNCLSADDSVPGVPERNFAKRRVVFVGRLTEQKGPDCFVEVAREVLLARGIAATFTAYGEGDLTSALMARASTPSETRTISPKPQQIPPLSKDSVQRLCSPISIRTIAPAEMQAKSIRAFAEKQGDEKVKLIDFVFSVGFTATALAPGEPYSHLLELPEDVPQGVLRSYVATVDGVERTHQEMTVQSRQLVDFAGKVRWAERRSAFRNASVILVPSRSEPFGMVILEAMQEGIPVIFTEGAGVGEVVDAGVRVPANAPSTMAEQLVQLLQDEAGWRQQAAAGLAAVKDYARVKQEEKLISLWAELVERPTRLAGASVERPAEFAAA